jgi:hypothetical protein
MNPIIFFEQHITHILFVKFSAKSPHLKYLVASYFGTDGRSRRNTMSSCLFGCALKRILTHVPVARWAPADKKSLRHVSAGRVSAEVPRWARTIAGVTYAWLQPAAERGQAQLGARSCVAWGSSAHEWLWFFVFCFFETKWLWSGRRDCLRRIFLLLY